MLKLLRRNKRDEDGDDEDNSRAVEDNGDEEQEEENGGASIVKDRNCSSLCLCVSDDSKKTERYVLYSCLIDWALCRVLVWASWHYTGPHWICFRRVHSCFVCFGPEPQPVGTQRSNPLL